jgi:DNA-binding transcriptional MerR regulator
MKEAGIPEKLFFKIGEVAEIAQLRPSVLRFWETEFSFLSPQKSRSGQRLYSRQEVDLILEIRRLLYGEKLTIEGAKRRLAKPQKRNGQHAVEVSSEDLYDVLCVVRTELQKIRDLL